MCGIFGGLDYSGQTIDDLLVSRMSHAVARRGPDDQGEYRHGPVVLGHRRLKVIDLSARGHQPMTDADGRFTIVFNGAIYNHLELRRALLSRGFNFRSHSDTEVILNAFACWGPGCLQKLEGMFAFAIWDSREQNLFLARDRLGIKPLYYADTGRQIFFASNVQALLQTGACDSSLDPAAIHHVMTLHAVVPAPATLLRGVRKCPPAHSMWVNRYGELHTERYWDLVCQRVGSARSDAEWREKIHLALLDSVHRRLSVSDVPVGILLSGGLDSSLLVALAAETGAASIETFSIGFEDSPQEAGDEFAYSDQVADLYGTNHHKYRIANGEVLRRLPEALASMAEPMFGQDAIAFYLLAEQVSASASVVQSGQGADEVFAGYSWYSRMLATPGRPLQRFSPWYFDRDHAEYLAAVAPEYHVNDVSGELVAAALDKGQADTFMDRVLCFDITTLMVDDPVKRIDNMTMAWGLEARVPFLDHRLVELAAQCPPELKLLQHGKGVLKSIARGRLPDAIIDRPKGYFPVPALKYIRGEFYQFMADTLNSRQSHERGLFSRAYINRLLKEPDSHFTPIGGSKLWQCAALEFWLQQHI